MSSRSYILQIMLWQQSVAYLGFHFGGGVQNFSGKVGVFVWRKAPCSAWRSHAFARGVRGHAPPRKFLESILLKFCQNNNLKNCHFLYKSNR